MTTITGLVNLGYTGSQLLQIRRDIRATCNKGSRQRWRMRIIRNTHLACPSYIAFEAGIPSARLVLLHKHGRPSSSSLPGVFDTH